MIHSYWVPALAGKQDVVPGRVVHLNLQADETGRFPGQCTEYCGLSHANMRNRAVVLEPDEFDQWVKDQQQPAAQPASGSPAAEGYELIFPGEDGNQLSCVGCHNLRTDDVAAAGTTPTANTGPDLTHLMSRKEFAGAIFDLYKREDPNDPNSAFTDEPNVEQLRAWVQQRRQPEGDAPRAGLQHAGLHQPHR